MRDLLTTLVELVGAASITVGAALVDPALGFITAGALLIAGSLLAAGEDS